MRRFERKRFERLRRQASVAGVSFALGALAATAVQARLESAATSVRVEQPAVALDDHRGATATTGVVTPARATALLDDRRLLVPVKGVDRDDLRDNFADPRSGGRAHEAIDIMAPRGTEVRAVADGVIEKLFTSKAGGITVYQFDASGVFCYYYAHLDGYASGLAEGQDVSRGDLIGYVGSTGNAAPDAPHLHFAIFRLGPERQWWKGNPINPYPLLAAE